MLQTISSKKKALVDSVVRTTIWYICRLRNDKVFTGGTLKQSDITDSIHHFFCLLKDIANLLYIGLIG